MSATLINEELRKMLADRSVDFNVLAQQISSRRSHVSQVLLGRRRGTATWRKLKDVLQAKEYEVAKEFADAQLKERERKGLPTGEFPKGGFKATPALANAS